MKIGLERLLVVVSALGFGLIGAACANATQPTNPNAAVSAVDGGDGGKSETTEETEDDPPHAMGVIQLTEAHTAGASTSSPSVTAGFVPTSDATAKTCGREVDGCTIVAMPDCKGDSGISKCGSDEICKLDENCDSVCEAVPMCDPPCDKDQVCQLKGFVSKCVAKPEFNAGVITLSGEGVTKSVTLRPPYSYSAGSTDSPFVPEAEIKVNASGATESGYEKFTDSFTSTTLIQTSPALEKLDPEVVFEDTGPVTVGWKPGEDEVQVTVTGNKATAQCKVDDAAGTFDITRKVIRAVYDDTLEVSTPSLTVSVGRSKTKLKKDAQTKGEIEGVDLPPVGFVRMVTQSIETFTVQGCTSGYKRCPSTSGTTSSCVSIMTDRYNCGACGKTCLSSQYCYSGVCQ